MKEAMSEGKMPLFNIDTFIIKVARKMSIKSFGDDNGIKARKTEELIVEGNRAYTACLEKLDFSKSQRQISSYIKISIINKMRSKLSFLKRNLENNNILIYNISMPISDGGNDGGKESTLEDVICSGEPSPSDRAEAKEINEILIKNVQQLNPIEKDILVQIAVDNEPVESLAMKYDFSPYEVMKIFNNAGTKIRNSMKDLVL